jgi:hypothetical protein
MKDKSCNHSVYTEKAFENNPNHFYGNNSQQTGYKRNLPQYNKTIHNNPTANVTANGEKLKAFPLW